MEQVGFVGYFLVFHSYIYPYISKSYKSFSILQLFRYFRMYLPLLTDEEKDYLFTITESILGGNSLKQIAGSLQDWIKRNGGYQFIPDYIKYTA